MDPMGGIVMTNDGNAILREITVQHPAAKSMIEIARTQDEEVRKIVLNKFSKFDIISKSYIEYFISYLPRCFQVGDGTTSVIVLTGEILAVAEPFLSQNIHPTVIIREYRQALEDAVKLLQEKISVPVDINDKDKLKEVVSTILIQSTYSGI